MSDPELRILVALDPSAPSADVFLAISGFASAFHNVEVRGVFVADDNLMRLASLPVLREVSASGSLGRSESTTDLRQQVETRAQRVRSTFEFGVRHLHVQHSFTICRGNVIDELCREARQSDLTVIAHATRQVGFRTWLGVAIRELLLDAPTDVLFVQEPWTTGKTILLIENGDGGDAARAIRIAQRMAANDRLRLVSATLQPSTDAAAELLHLCQVHQARVVVMHNSEALRNRVNLNDFLQRVSSSLLLLHSEHSA